MDYLACSVESGHNGHRNCARRHDGAAAARRCHRERRLSRPRDRDGTGSEETRRRRIHHEHAYHDNDDAHDDAGDDADNDANDDSNRHATDPHPAADNPCDASNHAVFAAGPRAVYASPGAHPQFPAEHRSLRALRDHSAFSSTGREAQGDAELPLRSSPGKAE